VAHEGSYETQEEFARGVRAARAWADPPIKNRRAYSKLILGNDSDSSGERLEEGFLGKKRNSPEARRQVARTIVEKTGCPPALFGLSEPESDPRWKSVEDRLNFLLEAVRRLAGAQDAPDEFQQWFANDPRSGGLDL
jgi:hypothetical protein